MTISVDGGTGSIESNGAALESKSAATADSIADSIVPQLKLTLDDVSLWPVRPDDVEFLYWIATCDQNAYRWRFRGNIPSFESFQSSLHTGVLAQFVVHSRDLGRKIGHVVAYDSDMSAGHVHLAAVMDPNFMYIGAGRDALRLFAGYLLETWSFRTIYAEVPSYLFELFESSASLNEHLPFRVVGRLPDYLFHQGRHFDMVILAITRDEFDAANPRLLGSVT